MAVKAVRLSHRLFPNYQVVCTGCHMLLIVEQEKDLTIFLKGGRPPERIPQVKCASCGKTFSLPKKDRKLALVLYDSRQK